MSTYPLDEMSDAEISAEIVRANARIDAVEHTKWMLLRELESRADVEVRGQADTTGAET